MATRNLDSVLRPRSIAVVGASESPGKVGTVVLKNLLSGGFTGPILPINAHRDTVQGLRAYKSVNELPEAVDLVIVCIPAPGVAEVVRQCGERGVGGLIILTAGFREIGAAGRQYDEALQRELRAFPNLRVVGPNCLGVIVPGVPLNASFAAGMPAAGRVAFVSQSGALCTAMLDWAEERSLGFSHFISIGNMIDVDLADLLDDLADDDATDAVILYIESITAARRFMSAARACARRKPVVACKAGRFPLSSRAAASHTGAMAGVDSVYEAAFERAGIVRVLELDELFDCAQLLASGPRVCGTRLAIVTNAGGPGVLACDALLARQGELATLSSVTMDELDRILPPYWSHGNPIDLLGDAPPERYSQAMQIVADAEEVDAVLAILTPQAMTNPAATAEAVVTISRQTHKPILANWMGGRTVAEGVAILNRAGVPTARTPTHAISAFMHLVRYGHNLDLLYETPREVPLQFDGQPRRTADSLRQMFTSDRDVLYESEAKSLLTAYGIPVAEVRLGHSADEVATLARDIGFPIVLKLVSPQVTHKTDVGGVRLNLVDEAQVRAAYQEIIDSVRQARPDARIEGISVQPMVSLPGGIELILGAKKDPVFGPVMMVGVGGIAAELFHDAALGLPPLNERLALRMLKSLRAWPLLQGFRSRQPIADVDRLIEILLRFSMLLADFPEIAEFDANPVLVRGRQVIALDARAIVDRQAVAHPSPVPFAHLAIRPYPEDLSEEATLADGTAVVLRPIKPEDEPLWRELLASCSPETLWQRFRFTFKSDSHESAIRFCFIDYDCELGTVVEAEVDGARKLLGVARLVRDHSSERGEFAVLIGDPWQGNGLGTLLTQYCVQHADRINVREIYATTAQTNTRMIKVFARLGFTIGPDAESAIVLATKRVS
jgi:acetyltransferase